mgnify:FL=1|tara:strand:- start:229 stop:627 length:399 start_codon:yes stop_codon:yes gene_type:complete
MKSKSLIFRFLTGIFSTVVILVFSSCFGGGSSIFTDRDKEVDENVKNLMGLSVGMTKGDVEQLAGVPNMLEGYDWGSVWRYKTIKGASSGTLSNKDIDKSLMPIVFDNTDRVIGYGHKCYEDTLRDLGSSRF